MINTLLYLLTTAHFLCTSFFFSRKVYMLCLVNKIILILDINWASVICEIVDINCDSVIVELVDIKSHR